MISKAETTDIIITIDGLTAAAEINTSRAVHKSHITPLYYSGSNIEMTRGKSAAANDITSGESSDKFYINKLANVSTSSDDTKSVL